MMEGKRQSHLKILLDIQMSKETMFQEYITFYKTYTQIYGPKTTIFLMVGSFYELYDILHTDTGKTECNVREVVDYLGIQLSTKRGEFKENEEGLFAGFPDYVLHKWAGRLTSAGWTVVIVDQQKDARGKVKERKVSRILSPSTHIENTSAIETPYVLTIFFDQTVQQQPPQFGAGLLDLTTGSTMTYSGHTQGRPDLWTADELVQLMSVFQPKEILLYWRSTYALPNEQTLSRILGISPGIPIHRRLVETLGSFRVPLARSEYLQKIYQIRSVLPPTTYLGLRTEHEELALVYLLQFVEEHYPSMLTSFHRNEPWTPQSHLICGNHALTQLQMTSLTSQPSVIGLFDKCITTMGKRTIRNRILRPYTTSQDILGRLAEVNDMMGWTDLSLKQLDRQLRFMYDLPRLHRKLLCGLILPAEVAGLFQTYHAMEVIRSTVTPQTTLVEPFHEDQWKSYLEVFRTHFSEEKAKQASADLTIFSSEQYPEVYCIEQDIRAQWESLDVLKKEMAKKGGVTEEQIRVEEREKEPVGFKASTLTLQQMKKHLKVLPEGTRITELKSGGWIDCSALQRINTSIQKLRETLQGRVREYLLPACHTISMAGHGLWTMMEEWVCHLDHTQCIAKVSQEQGWSCPEIVSEEKSAWVEVEQLRHPLVEASATRVSYVKHNVSLGGDRPNGWLVYGMNASGKSTLMKATGISILLAQAGCFVPCKKMRLSPFESIYTRILNHDNLFAGLSSFAVEMSELRDILRYATPKTLVLGDELCSGTESISAQALVASGIQWLTAKQAKFIFATHLHDLPNWIDTESGVEVWHLHVEYDPLTKKLVYDRSLRPGTGSTLYGLEVARAMDLPFDFIENALKIRHRIMGSTIQDQASASSWNTEVVKRVCEVCSHPICSELEVHHMQPRSSADLQNRLTDGSHMNEKRNLIVVCQSCHDRIHAGEIEAGPIQMTSDGPMREITQLNKITDAPTKTIKRSKWTDEEMQIMTDTVKKYSSLSLKSIRAHLSSSGIQVSEAVLSSIRKTV
jgi:DNA mismatch repair protein MutS